LQRRLEVALGIDLERCRRDDFFSLAEPVENLDIAVASAAELDRARLEAAFPFGDQHDPAGPTVDDGACGNGDRRLFVCSRLEHYVGIHIDLQAALGIRQLDPHARRSRLCPQLRVDERDFALDRLRRVSAHRDGGAGANLD